MPELPDIEAYRTAVEARVTGEPALAVRVTHPFLLRTVTPPPEAAVGRRLLATHRIGKRISLEFEGGLHVVVHLMIAGRLQWRPTAPKLNPRLHLLAIDFPPGSLLLTEAGRKRRAALHVIEGPENLAQLDRGGLEVIGSTLEAFAAAVVRENRTLKRALTDPRILSGIGNAYSDEILHRARLSPLRLTRQLASDELRRLHQATIELLSEWTSRLRAEALERWPEKVTAFRPEFAVHGKHGMPCPVCGQPVQRIVYAENETNYCARCQTEGRLLADRALSRLLREDWPRTLEELEEVRPAAGRAD